MAHTIEVPDLVWDWAARETGKNKPATFLRDLLTEKMMEKVRSTPAHPPRKERLVTQRVAEFNTVCPVCRSQVLQGNKIMIVTLDSGKSGSMHQECYDRWRNA